MNLKQVLLQPFVVMISATTRQSVLLSSISATAVLTVPPDVSKLGNFGLMFHQQQGYTEMIPLFKVSSKRAEKQGISVWIPRFIV